MTLATDYFNHDKQEFFFVTWGIHWAPQNIAYQGLLLWKNNRKGQSWIFKNTFKIYIFFNIIVLKLILTTLVYTKKNHIHLAYSLFTKALWIHRCLWRKKSVTKNNIMGPKGWGPSKKTKTPLLAIFDLRKQNSCLSNLLKVEWTFIPFFCL